MKEKEKRPLWPVPTAVRESRPKIEELKARLKEMGLLPVEMGPLYRKILCGAGPPKSGQKP